MMSTSRPRTVAWHPLQPALGPAALLLLHLAPGCHLLANGSIDRTCEDLPRGCLDTDTATIDTADTADNTPPINYSSHMVVGIHRGGEVELVVYSPAGETVASVSAALTTMSARDSELGPVAWDPDNALFYWNENATFMFHIFPQTGESTSLSSYYTAEDLLVKDGKAWLGSQYYVFSYDPHTGEELNPNVLETYFNNIAAVFPAYDDNLYIVALGASDEDLPELYRGNTTTGEVTLTYENFDDGQNRAQDGFSGPFEQPYTCSIAGAIYEVEALKAGERTPIAFPDEADMEALTGSPVISDVVDCAWDSSSERYLLLSNSLGLFSIDETGSVDSIRSPEAGSSFFRGAFY